MSQHNFYAIKQQYPSVIAQMPDQFTAHEFILRLARENQTLYIEALYAYRKGTPFQAVHAQLATMLNDFPQLLQRDGDEANSVDIWTNSQGCSRWKKVVPSNEEDSASEAPQAAKR